LVSRAASDRELGARGMSALPAPRISRPSVPQGRGAEVIAPKAFQLEPAELLRALAEGRRGAKEALFREHAPYVERVLSRVLGDGPDVADTIQDVFLQVFRNIGNVREPEKLRPWIRTVTVMTARKRIRSRRRARWLRFWPFDAPELEVESHDADDVTLSALRATYRVLDRLPTDLRLVFTLRFVEEMELTEIAEATGVSLATVKRHLQKAQQRFSALAKTEPSLADRLNPSGGQLDE
jgi:RNA polymerase sigma-70 factor, ECF subfamily